MPEIERIWDAIEKNAWIPWVSMVEVARKREQPIIRKGAGIYLEDIRGNQYLDASSGPVAVNYGYGNEKIVNAIKAQLSQLHFLHYRIGGYNSDTLYFTPPLIIKKDEIDKMCGIAAEVLREFAG